jgi:hypothetical protein
VSCLDLVNFDTGWASDLSTMAVGKARIFITNDEVLRLELLFVARRETVESYHDGTCMPETSGTQAC